QGWVGRGDDQSCVLVSTRGRVGTVIVRPVWGGRRPPGGRTTLRAAARWIQSAPPWRVCRPARAGFRGRRPRRLLPDESRTRHHWFPPGRDPVRRGTSIR